MSLAVATFAKSLLPLFAIGEEDKAPHNTIGDVFGRSNLIDLLP